MKTFKQLINGFIAVVLMFFMIALVATPGVSAIPYGNDAPPTPTPTFNAYTGVPDVGNESDFFRVRVDGDAAEPVSDLSSSCETGKKFQFRVYVHNGASQYKNDNGNGPSVAKNTKVKVNLNNANAKSVFDTSANISASNAATVTDGATIRCNDGKIVKLSYVAGSAQQYNPGSGVKPISDSIVTTGAAIGTNGPDGNMWGCWDQRVWVRLVVEVTEQPKTVVGDGVCKVNDVVVLNQDKRNVRATVNGVTTGQGASIVGYEINWGDGSAVSNKQTDTHTYAKDGTYKIVGRVQVKLPDGTTKWVTSTECTRTVKFEAGKPPVVPPVTPPTTVTTLPNTGAGNLFGIFAGVSAVSAGAYQVVMRRRAARS